MRERQQELQVQRRNPNHQSDAELLHQRTGGHDGQGMFGLGAGLDHTGEE